ncbi:hypothetical protein SAMN05660226_02973 [Parapedobacter luteus]|uniref:Uncharacterized protein n=1 Tax=Parapedobacter luteus TaxID=623280 RepID=A0A1T5DTH4_9SPHI|nr:hypothetical protein SAMN05660226_02973 [Parapedobacter luteus]
MAEIATPLLVASESGALPKITGSNSRHENYISPFLFIGRIVRLSANGKCIGTPKQGFHRYEPPYGFRSDGTFKYAR